jgi:hypothetical protein
VPMTFLSYLMSLIAFLISPVSMASLSLFMPFLISAKMGLL